MMEKEIQEHLGLLRGYLAHMTENNWRDMALRCERQLNDLERAVALQGISDILKHDIRMAAQRDELLRALEDVEYWWLEEGMKHFNGVPYAIFATRAAIKAAREGNAT